MKTINILKMQKTLTSAISCKLSNIIKNKLIVASDKNYLINCLKIQDWNRLFKTICWNKPKFMTVIQYYQKKIFWKLKLHFKKNREIVTLTTWLWK